MYRVWCENAARPLTQTLQCSRIQVLVLVGTFPGTVRTPQKHPKTASSVARVVSTAHEGNPFNPSSHSKVQMWFEGWCRILSSRPHPQRSGRCRGRFICRSVQTHGSVWVIRQSNSPTSFLLFYHFSYFCLKSFFFDTEKKIQLVGAGSFSSKRGHIQTSPSHVWITRDYLFLWQGSTRFTDWIFSNPAALQRHCKCIQWPLH